MIAMRKYLNRIGLVLLIVLFFIQGIASAQTQTVPIQIDIPAQEMSRALETLALKFSISLVFSSDDVRNMQSTAVSGDYLPTQALEVILKGTNLTYETSGISTISIKKKSRPPVEMEKEPKESALSTKPLDMTPEEKSAPKVKQIETAPVNEKETSYDRYTLEEITVTANRVESPASKTPIAVTAVTGNQITHEGLSDPLKLEEVVPNLSIVRSVLGLQFTIRGVTSNDNTEKGDPSVAFIIDNVYIARPNYQEVSFYDIARVEVLRGPQGTLYGRNTTAGVVNVITNKPKELFEAAFNATIGDYNTYLADGMINVPVSNNFALRAAFSYQRRDSYMYQPYGDYSIDPFKDNLSFRLQGLYHINDHASLLLQTDYSKLKGTGKGDIPMSLFDVSDPRNPRYIGGLSSKEMRTDLLTVSTLPVTNENNTWGINAEFNWDFGPVALTYLASYRGSDANTMGSNDSQTEGVPATLNTFTGDYWQHQEEIRLATAGDGPFKGQMGFYYFKEKSGIAFWMYDTGFADKFGFSQDPTINESIAGYGQGTYSLTPDLRLTAGVRYSRDEKSRVGATVFLNPVFIPFPIELRNVNDAARTFSKTTWRLGLDYDLNDQTLLYGSVATGYKAGGFNDGCEAEMPGCNQARDLDLLYYDPETLTAYEIGTKTKFSDEVVLNSSAFYYDYNNLQLSTIVEIPGTEGGTNQVTQNAAKAEVKGVEIESAFMPTDYIRINANLSWLDAAYKDYWPLGEGNAPDYAGKPLDRSPEFTVSFGYHQRIPLPNGASIEGALQFRWSDSYKLTYYNIPAQYEQPGYHKTDLSVTYASSNGAWYFQVFGKNLEDKITLMIAGPDGITPGDPRTFGARVGVRF